MIDDDDDEDDAPFDPDAVIEVPLTDELDLHTFAPRDVADVVTEYVRAAAEKGFREVRIIHGKGVGVQRRIVHGVLDQHPDVASHTPAPERRGGWGATIVTLRTPPPKEVDLGLRSTGRMRASRLLSWLLVVLACLTVGAPVARAEDPDPRVLEEAAARYDRGVKLYEAGDYPGALAEFEAVYKLTGRYEVLFNIALTQK